MFGGGAALVLTAVRGRGCWPSTAEVRDAGFLGSQRIDEVKVRLALLQKHTKNKPKLVSLFGFFPLPLCAYLFITCGDEGKPSLGELFEETFSVGRPNLLKRKKRNLSVKSRV